MISIIIPAYNAGHFLQEAVISALEQRPERELIVVDDSSTDGSVEALCTYLCQTYDCRAETKHPSVTEECPCPAPWWQSAVLTGSETVLVRIYRNKHNIGVAGARNIGVQAAGGEYIALLDADDRWRGDKLEIQLSCIEETGACLVNTARVLVRQDGSSTGHVIHTPDKITLSMLEKTNYINCSSVLVRREIMLKYPMEHSEDHEDYLTWLRMLREYEYAVGVDEPLLEYRLSAGGKSRNKLKAAGMTYRTYRHAGYGRFRSAGMMFSYALHGIGKYRFKNMF